MEFSTTGLHDPETAAISIPDANGGYKLIIEIGSPSAKKLHKATKVSRAVRVYTYKTPERFITELKEEKIHRAEEISFYSFEQSFLDNLSQVIKRDNKWALLVNDSDLTVQAGEHSILGEIKSHRFEIP